MAEDELKARIAELEADQVANTTKLTEFTNQQGTWEAEKSALIKAAADKDLSIAQHQNTSSDTKTELETAQAALKAAEEKVVVGAESAAKLITLTTTNEELTKSITDSMVVRLKASGVSDDILKDKSKDQLEAMEQAIALTRVNGKNNVAGSEGLGLGGGGNLAPADQTDLERDVAIINKAKKAAGVPTT